MSILRPYPIVTIRTYRRPDGGIRYTVTVPRWFAELYRRVRLVPFDDD